MSRPAFPASVGNGGTRILRDGYSYRPPPNVDVSNPGPSEKRRRKSTASWEERRVTFSLPWAEWLTFKAFVEADLLDGALRFDWQPPENAAPAISRFKVQDDRPYQASPAPGGRMRVSVTIESLVIGVGA
jgi:hypothetical protein